MTVQIDRQIDISIDRLANVGMHVRDQISHLLTALPLCTWVYGWIAIAGLVVFSFIVLRLCLDFLLVCAMYGMDSCERYCYCTGMSVDCCLPRPWLAKCVKPNARSGGEKHVRNAPAGDSF